MLSNAPRRRCLCLCVWGLFIRLTVLPLLQCVLTIQSGPPVEDCQALARSTSQQGADNVADPLAGFGGSPSAGVFGGVEGQGQGDALGQGGQRRKIFDFGDGNDFLNILRERKRREEAAVAVAVERMRMYLATPEGEAELLKESFLMEGSEDPRVSMRMRACLLRCSCQTMCR